MRFVAVVVPLVMIGCSAFEMKRLEPDYDPRTNPRCDTDPLYAVGDAVGAAGAATLAIAIAAVGHDAADGTSKMLRSSDWASPQSHSARLRSADSYGTLNALPLKSSGIDARLNKIRLCSRRSTRSDGIKVRRGCPVASTARARQLTKQPDSACAKRTSVHARVLLCLPALRISASACSRRRHGVPMIDVHQRAKAA